MFRVNNKDARTTSKPVSEIFLIKFQAGGCSLIKKRLRPRCWHCSSTFIVNFEYVSFIFLVFLWFSSKKQMFLGVILFCICMNLLKLMGFFFCDALFVQMLRRSLINQFITSSCIFVFDFKFKCICYRLRKENYIYSCQSTNFEVSGRSQVSFIKSLSYDWSWNGFHVKLFVFGLLIIFFCRNNQVQDGFQNFEAVSKRYLTVVLGRHVPVQSYKQKH